MTDEQNDVLNDVERRFLRALEDLRIRYLVVGMSAALLQGSRGSTDDYDLWLETRIDPRLFEAAKRAGCIWISGSFGMMQPRIGGEGMDRFDIVTHMHGLGSFDDEYRHSIAMTLAGVDIKLLPLARILVSKRAAGRPKDLAQIPAIEVALSVIHSTRGTR